MSLDKLPDKIKTYKNNIDYNNDLMNLGYLQTTVLQEPELFADVGPDTKEIRL